MSEVEIRFARESLEGIVPQGTYLIDAAKRFGIRFEAPCVPEQGEHHCTVTVSQGIDLLSPLTTAETEHFDENGRRTNERLACQARIEKGGEIIVMTDEKKKQQADEAAVDDTNEQYRKEFADMPLEKKIASLVQLEAIALGETFSFIINSPYKVFDKMMDVMAEFGFRKEEAAKNATRPEEHRAESSNGEGAKKQRSKRARKQKPAE